MTKQEKDKLREMAKDLLAAWPLNSSQGVSATQINALLDELDKKELENKKLSAGIQFWNDVMAESRGVAGYHLNGDVAEWDEFQCAYEQAVEEAITPKGTK